MNKQEILKQIMEMEMNTINTFKLSDSKFLFVECWECKETNEMFTSLELNEGYEDKGNYVLDEVLECGTYTFKDENDIFTGIEYMINCI